MHVTTCPALWLPMMYHPIRIFLAGGISNCPNWQELAIDYCNQLPDSVMLYNPRRPDFDVSDPLATKKQIHWEHMTLEYSTAVMFWFPKDTLCPITLFELGKLAGKKPIVVGTDPNYARRLDVVEQLSYIAPDVIVRDNLEDVVADLYEHVFSFDVDAQTRKDIPCFHDIDIPGGLPL